MLYDFSKFDVHMLGKGGDNLGMSMPSSGSMGILFAVFMIVFASMSGEGAGWAVGLVVVVVGMFVLAVLSRRKDHDQRLERFAHHNNTYYEARVEGDKIARYIKPHSLLARTSGATDQTVWGCVSDAQDMSNFAIGSYSFTRKLLTEEYMQYHFFRVKVDGWLPHVLLESRSSRLSIPMERVEGRMIFERDFHKTFRVTLAAGTERDALRVLTPDVMEFLQSELSDYNIELVDNEVLVYKSGLLPVDEDYFQWVFYWLDQIQREIGKQAIKQRVDTTSAEVQDAQPDMYISERISTQFLLGVIVLVTFGVVWLAITLESIMSTI